MSGTKISRTESELFTTAFEAAQFLEIAKRTWPDLNENDRWIRSGVHIGADFKDYFASYRMIASYAPAGTHSRFEVLFLRPQPGMDLQRLKTPALQLVEKHMLENGVEGILFALPSGTDETWRYYFLSRAKSGTTIPEDILRYMCTQTLKKFLHSHCPFLNSAAIDGYFSAFNFLYDDLPIQQNAKEIDRALAEIKVCDISANNLQMLSAMAEQIAGMRDHLAKYISTRAPHSHQDHLRDFWVNAAYASDLDAGALELLKLDIRAMLPEGAKINDSHFAFGSVLHEDLFAERFDVVLTNPPHVRQEEFSQIKDTFVHSAVYHKGADLYCYYIERAFSLLADKGVLATLTSNRWLRSDYGAPLRAFLAAKNITDIVDYGNIPAMRGVVTPLSVVIATADAQGDTTQVTLVSERVHEALPELAEETAFAFRRDRLDEKPWNFETASLQDVMQKIREIGVPLDTYVEGRIYRGILTGLNEAFVVDKKEADEISRSDAASGTLLRPFLSGRNVKRYAAPAVKKYLIFIPRGFTDKHRGNSEAWEWFRATYPAAANRLAQHEAKAKMRKDRGDYWWELRSCKYYDEFETAKIISPSIVNRISATMDEKGLFSNDKTSIVCSDDYYLLGLLNSRLMDFYARRITTELLNGYFELKPANLSTLPIREISETNGFQRKLRDEVREHAKTISLLSAKPKADRSEQEEDRITEAERALNRTVYRLYKLTPQEISIVENN